MTQVSTISVPVPGTPRPITAKVRRRSWLEPQVRIWLMCATLVLIITSYVMTDSIVHTSRHNALLRDGVPLAVTIVSANDWTTAGSAQQRDHRANVVLRSSTLDGSREFKGTLEAAAGYLVIGNQMKISVDPHDDANWTEFTDPEPLTHDLGVPMMLLPVILGAFAIAIVRRWQIVRIWREGVVCQGVVSGRRHTAIAPFSSLVRYVLADGEDNLVRTALFPRQVAVPARGEMLTLLAHPNNAHRTIVAEIYH